MTGAGYDHPPFLGLSGRPAPASGPFRRWFLVAPRTNLPAAGRNLAGLIEHAAVRAREKDHVGNVEPAALGTLARAHSPHDVVPAVLVDAHVTHDRTWAVGGPGGRDGGIRVEHVSDVPASTRDLVRWGETLAAIARTGLAFTKNLYEQERYEEILKVAGDIRAAAASALARDGQPVATSEADELVVEWMEDVRQGVAGYVTPKVAVGAIVGNDEGQILLVQRADSGAWLYPTGWADVGYSAAEVAVKEVLEETGIDVEPVRLVMVLDGLRLGFTQVPLYSLVFHLRPVGGSLQATRSSAPTSAGSARTPCPPRSPMPACGASTRSPRYGATRSRFSSIGPEARSGGRDGRRSDRPEPHFGPCRRPAYTRRMKADGVACGPRLGGDRRSRGGHGTPGTATFLDRDIARSRRPGGDRGLAREHALGRPARLARRHAIVGMTTLIVYRIPTGMHAVIEDVVVDESARGHGVGAALVSRAVQARPGRRGTPRQLDVASLEAGGKPPLREGGFRAARDERLPAELELIDFFVRT